MRLILCFAAFVSAGFAQCTLSLTSNPPAALTGSGPAYQLWLDNQGTAQLPNGAISLAITPTSDCGTWALTSGPANTYTTTLYGPTVQTNHVEPWYFFNDAKGAANCGTPNNGSAIARTGTASVIGSGTQSVTVAVCPNPTPGIPVDRFSDRSDTLSLSATGAPPISIQIYTARSQQLFADVPPAPTSFDAMNIVTRRGIYTPATVAQTCSQDGGPNACPDVPITRDEAAQWLVRSIYGNDNFAYSPTPWFRDVPASHPYFPWIQALRELGIQAAGCDARRLAFCPARVLTRDQMAVFLIGARYGGLASVTIPTPQYFTDVPPSAFAYGPIERLQYDNLSPGCTLTTYCPQQSVTRRDFAVMLSRASLNQLLPAAAPVLTYSSVLSFVQNSANLPLVISGLNTQFTPSSTVARVEGCTYAAGTPCPANLWSITAPDGTTTATNLSLTISTSGLSPQQSPHAHPIPQSLVVSTNIGGGDLPNGAQELVLPHVVRLVDQPYPNLALPANWNPASGVTQPGPQVAWNQILLPPSQVTGQISPDLAQIQFNLSASAATGLYIPDWSTSFPFEFVGAAPDALTATPRPPMTFAFTDFTPSVAPTETSSFHWCEIDRQDNYDASHPVLYQSNIINQTINACPYNAPDFPTWPYLNFGDTPGETEMLESLMFPGNPVIMSAPGTNRFLPTDGVKGFLSQATLGGTATVPGLSALPSGTNYTSPNNQQSQRYCATAAEVIYMTSQGCSGGGSEYGLVSFLPYSVPDQPDDPCNSPGSLNFYFSDYTNCPFESGGACFASLDQSTVQGNTRTEQVTGNAFVTNLSPVPANGSYFYGAYLIADPNPQGFRLRVQISVPDAVYGALLAKCTLKDNAGTVLNPDGYCSADLSFTGAIGNPYYVPFSNASPEYGTRLYNTSASYVALIQASPTWGCDNGSNPAHPVFAYPKLDPRNFPASAPGSGMQLTGAWIAR